MQDVIVAARLNVDNIGKRVTILDSEDKPIIAGVLEGFEAKQTYYLDSLGIRPADSRSGIPQIPSKRLCDIKLQLKLATCDTVTIRIRDTDNIMIEDA